MAATTAPFGVLPVLAYALVSLLLIYLGLRLARYLKSRQSSALPKPVSGGASTKSLTFLGGARSTASGWRQWSQSLPLPALPRVRVPWVRIPSLSENTLDDIGAAHVGAAQAKTKNGKNLAIELLPTTGLPPPPSSAPIFSPTPTRASTPALQQPQASQTHQHQQLVDISSPPSTPALTAASTSASGASFLGSPRTPSPPQFVPHGHGYPPKAVYTPQPAIHNAGPKSLHSPPYHARSPSPHALLATTSPVKQKRSRSLGGVPVRRLSSGAGSSLRHAVELEDGAVEMSLLGKKALRGKGEEQLLIDFSSSGSGSGSGEASEELDDPFVSPTASDIGVLSLNSTSQPPSSSLYTAYASAGPYGHSGYKVAPPVVSAAVTAAMTPTTVLPLRVDARQVGRHVPLVDLSDSDTPINEKVRVPTSSFDEDGWKWFGASSGTGSMSVATAAPAVVALKTPVAMAKANARREEEKEKLVDIDDDVPNASELVSDARVQAAVVTTPVTREVPHQHEKATSKEVPLVEIETSDEKEGMLIDVGFSDEDEERWARQTYPPRGLQSEEQERFYPTEKDNAYSNDIHPNEPRNDPDEPIHDGAHDATPEIKNDDTHIRLPSPVAFSASAPEAEPIAGEDTFAPSLPVGNSSEQAPSDAPWGWDDPWSGHLISPDARRVDFAQTADLIELELDAHAEMGVAEGEEEEKVHPAESETYHVSDVQEAREEEEIVEHSPAGLLKATVLDEDDDNESVPAFDLESLDLEAFVPFEAPEEVGAGEDENADQSIAPIIAEQETQAQEDEEEITPTPTPASSHAELPPALPEITLVDVEVQQAFDRPAEVFYPDPELLQLDDSWTMSSGVDNALSEKDVLAREQEEEIFPDPDLLPLPLASEADIESAQDTLEAVRSQLLAITDKGRPSTPTLSQTPTPPASPPPLHPINTTATANAFRLRSAKSRGASRVPSPTGTVNSVMAFPVMLAAEEDKENAALTPTTLAQQQRPAWSLRASDAPALGLPSSGSATGASPRNRRKALEDVNWGMGEEKDVVVVEEKKENADDEVVNALVPSQDKEIVEEKTHDEKEEEKEKDIPAADPIAPGLEHSTSLPGAFPDASPPTIVISPPVASTSASTISFPSTSSKESTPSTPTSPSTVAQRLRRASLSARSWTLPSTRTLVRSPLDIALAMQMRPGLGAGADPAWMVRFLMAVYGWLLVSVAGGDF